MRLSRRTFQQLLLMTAGYQLLPLECHGCLLEAEVAADSAIRD